MAKITVDGIEYEVKSGSNLLQECLSLGLDLPYFCWHPCMGSVGACRQCAVKQYRNAEDTQGTLVMACMTPVTEGARLSIADPQAEAFRAGVIESLMINHPHDCPVCEEGGECHLQDMTLMSGHNYRRYDKRKRTHVNQYLGPFIGHEMNRCIACYRCVRFYGDYAGGTDLAAQASHHHVYFGRHQDGCLESEFSGNLVEVCPTGVFTDATFSAHYTRKWDLQTAPAVCTGCGVGCNITPGERYGTLRRVVNRYHGDINGYFLCDRGRFGYGHVNAGDRIRESSLREGGEARALTPADARAALQSVASGTCIGIGSPRAGVEANAALRDRVGADNFYAGCDEDQWQALQMVLRCQNDPLLHTPSVRDMEAADAVLVIGEDVTNTAARVALALRQSVRNRAFDLANAARIPVWQDAAVRELAQDERSPLHILAGHATRLDDVARSVHIDAAAGLLAQVQAITAAVQGSDPVAGNGSNNDLARQVAADLLAARRPLIVTGARCGHPALLEAAANLARAVAQQRAAAGSQEPMDFCALVPESNSVGLALLAAPDHSLTAALQRLQGGTVQRLIVLETDLYEQAPAAVVDAALAPVTHLAVIDQLPTATTDRATLLLASAAFPEQESVRVNYEGRAQLSLQVYPTPSGVLPAWHWLADPGTSFNSIITRLAASGETWRLLADVLPDPAHFPAGMKVPRQTARASGRTAFQANVQVHEPKQPQDPDSVMAFSMEGVVPLKDASVLPYTWAPQWNSNQSVTKFLDEIGGHLRQGESKVLLRDSRSPAAPMASAPVEAGDNDQFALIEAFHLFGSETLSARAEPIQERIPQAYAALCPADAERLGVGVGTGVRISSASGVLSVPVVLRQRVRPGTVVVFPGPSRQSVLTLGGQVTLEVGEPTGERFNNLIVSDRVPEGV